MSVHRQVLMSFGTALMTGIIVLGSFSLSIIESGFEVAQIPGGDFFEDGALFPTFVNISQGILLATSNLTREASITPTNTFAPPPNCPPPPGWTAIMVKPGDTLVDLARVYQISIETLASDNCLPAVDTSIAPGSFIFVPTRSPARPVTKTPIHCVRPLGWMPYIVRYGDTLFSLSLTYGVPLDRLKAANCKGSSSLIRTGEVLYVPYVLYAPTITPWSYPTLPPTYTPLPTAQRPLISPTFSVPGYTNTPVPTSTNTATPANNMQPTATKPQPPTATPAQVLPPTPTFTPIPTLPPPPEPTLPPPPEPTLPPPPEPTLPNALPPPTQIPQPTILSNPPTPTSAPSGNSTSIPG